MEQIGRLFGSSARLKMLRLFIFNQDTAFTLGEIADRAKVTKEAARSELSDLILSKFLRKKGSGVSARYQVNPRFEHMVPLETFIRETTSVPPARMLEELRKAGSLRLVALSGLFTGIIESKVDLLVVGDVLNERALAKAVHALEAELGREIRYAFFPTGDFRYRLGVYDRLLRDVFDYPHRLLIDKIGL